ncbi:MAG TPA: hypothetical protein VIE13_06815 [Terriglobales bacterium]
MKGEFWTLTAVLALAAALSACNQSAPPAETVASPAAAADTSAARGSQLVLLGGCDDCHTPQLPNGEPDMSRRLSGVPEGSALPPAIPGVVTTLNLAWRGPWGLSEARNLTPDPQNGIGSWTQQQFLDTMRSGKDPAGRALQPPMPFPNYGRLPDSDLIALFNFLKTVPPNSNKVTGP